MTDRTSAELAACLDTLGACYGGDFLPFERQLIFDAANSLRGAQDGERIEGWALEERIMGRSTHIFNSKDRHSTAPRATLILHPEGPEKT